MRKDPYLNPDGSLNEEKLLADLLAYQGDRPILRAARQTAIEALETLQAEASAAGSVRP